jgi:hypothetical protein
MTLRLSWAEVADILKQHIHLPGVNLGEPRIFSQGAYGGPEEEVEAAALEFPVLVDIPALTPLLEPAHLFAAAAVRPTAYDPDAPF